MSLALAVQTQNTPGRNKIVFAHFDAHGVASAAVLARRVGAGVVSRYPDTGPQRFAQFISAMNLYGKEVYIVDIPVNVRAPKEFIAAINMAAQQAASIEYIDHHDTDLQYLPELRGVSTKFFSDAVSMAAYLAGGKEQLNTRDGMLALVGVVADRDKNVLRLVDRDTVERMLMPLANALDVLVRRDAQAAADALVAEGLAWLERMAASTDYPPYQLASTLEQFIAKRGHRAVMLNPVDTAEQLRQLESWFPKTAEQLMLRQGVEYIVAPTRQIDRRTGQPFWSVRVIQYWLSDGSSAEDIVARIPEAQQRQRVGHASYISIAAIDQQDAVRLAEHIFNEIERPVSHTAHLISERFVAEAIQTDYSKILQLLERIATALERGAAAKEKQVQLIEEDMSRRRYD